MGKLLEIPIAITLFISLTNCINVIRDNYLEINSDTEFDIEVYHLKNDRGAVTIDDKYWFPSASKVVEGDFENKKDIIKLFFRKDHIRPIPRFADLKPPFKLVKEKGDEQIAVIKERDTIFFKLSNQN